MVTVALKFRVLDASQFQRADPGGVNLRYWDKKNAAASLTLLIKVHSLIGMQTRGGTPSDNPGQDDDEAFALGQQVSKAEREAAAIIERLQKGKK
ncbi:hypothetical protein ABK921_12050 [Enterobacter kobei]|uniref:hypothetical protein n=1 Tax=Enterobacter kobei TaxID=208224 RepID=UPI0030762230